MSSMYARSGQDSPQHTSSTSIYSPQLKPSRYVQLAQLLRTRGRCALHVRMVRRTSNGYKDHLKPVSAIRKSQARTVRPPRSDGLGPVNMKYQSTNQFKQHGRTVRQPWSDGPHQDHILSS